jgi:DNA polymerase-3 subunit gamma/tau
MTDNVPAAMDRYVVVARRYRPRGFSQLVGQDHVGACAVRTRSKQVAVGHAYLFTGARGVRQDEHGTDFCQSAERSPVDRRHIARWNFRDVCPGDRCRVKTLTCWKSTARATAASTKFRSAACRRRGAAESGAFQDLHHRRSAHADRSRRSTRCSRRWKSRPPTSSSFSARRIPRKLPITVLSRCQRFDFAPVQTSNAIARSIAGNRRRGRGRLRTTKPCDCSPAAPPARCVTASLCLSR